MYNVLFGGKASADIKVYAKYRPDIPYPEPDIDEIIIPGRDGALHIDNGRKNGIDIEVEFNYICPEEKWFETWRKVGRWVSQRNQKLEFTDDKEFYYLCYYVTLDKNARQSIRTGNFKAIFHCAPAWYVNGGELEQEGILEKVYLINSDGEYIGSSKPPEKILLCNSRLEQITNSRGENILSSELFLPEGTDRVLSSIRGAIFTNHYSMCRPIYRIVGNGKCYLSVNDKGMAMEVERELLIDTERRIAYRNQVNLSYKIIGDYDDACLQEGVNKITLDGGFDLHIVPRWRFDG